MTKEKSEYDLQAEAVAAKLGIKVTAVYQGGECPPRAKRGKDSQRTAKDCPQCGTVHGDKFMVTVEREGWDIKKRIAFGFWAGFSDCYVERYPRGKPHRTFVPGATGGGHMPPDINSKWVHVKHTPSVYSLLSCLASDSSGPTDPDEVYREYGEMPPSQALAIAGFAQQVQNFFTEDELRVLQEVQ